jgi:PAS domain S-box-containing protein
MPRGIPTRRLHRPTVVPVDSDGGHEPPTGQRNDPDSTATALPVVIGQELLSAIWDSATDAIAVSDADGRVLMANPAYCALYGYGLADVIGRSFALIFRSEDRSSAETGYRATFHGPVPSGTVESVVQLADGSERTVEARFHFLTDGGVRTAMVSLVRDITDRKRLEQNEREFLAMVAHALRNPLASISGYTERMRRTREYSEHSMEAVLRQTADLNRLVGDLVDVAALEAGHLRLERQAVRPDELAKTVARQAQAGTDRHRIRVRIDGPIDTAMWDPVRIGQVLDNLLANAIKYSPEGGEILVSLRADGRSVRLSVSDAGIGISAPRVPRLFERFYRVPDSSDNAAGLGLGLAISRALVVAHGGSIEVESTVGRGSTFTIVLPFSGDFSMPQETAALTSRELEVARLIAAAHSNREIGERLCITAGTVANHIQHILAKLGVSNRGQITLWIVEHGLLAESSTGLGR